MNFRAGETLSRSIKRNQRLCEIVAKLGNMEQFPAWDLPSLPRSVFVRGKSAHPCSCCTINSKTCYWMHHMLENCCSLHLSNVHIAKQTLWFISSLPYENCVNCVFHSIQWLDLFSLTAFTSKDTTGGVFLTLFSRFSSHD